MPSQGRIRKSSPSSKSRIQIGHVSRPMASGITASFGFGEGSTVFAVIRGCGLCAVSTIWTPAGSSVIRGKCPTPSVTCPSSTQPARSTAGTSAVSGCGASMSFGRRISESWLLDPNLTTGNVSSIARPSPLARLWPGSPAPPWSAVRGPYRSGWRMARIACRR